jgi:aminoglycoside/choline kinase family phosphotransferase
LFSRSNAYFCNMTNTEKAKNEVIAVFFEWQKEKADKVVKLPQSGSERVYFRLWLHTKSFVAAYNPDQRENEAFVHLSGVFKKHQLNVAQVNFYNPEKGVYFIDDLGDEILFDLINKEKPEFSNATMEYLKTSLRALIKFQTSCNQDIDFDKCYPRNRFDKQAIQWDLNYFKYHFLKVFDIPFDEQKLEDDFQKLMAFLLDAKADYFMYRDFQSRNIMVQDELPWFIDFQGGRKGPLQYDVASLLFQVRAGFSWETKCELLEFYLQELSKADAKAARDFKKHYFAFVYLRLMQVMGAYGYRGIIQNKSHFLMSVPFAIKSMEELMQKEQLPPGLEELKQVFQKTIQLKSRFEGNSEKGKLTVNVNSISFKKSVLKDFSGNGGGHTFDCRALPNPGRQEKYKQLTGKDSEVAEYLSQHSEVGVFLGNTIKVAEQSIQNYLERGFDHLSVSYGCTGGQHRSVYCAEKLFAHLQNNPKLKVVLTHKELAQD